MGNELKPYDEYKEVDLLWINSVPSHWEIASNKAFWAERNIRNCIDEELLSVTIKQGVIRQKEFLRNSIKKDVSNQDKSNYKLVIHNDIAYNKMRMWQGAVGKSRYRGIVSPAYIVLQARRELNPDYFHYLLRTPEYIEESHRYSYGICDDQLNLRYEDFKRMKNIFPPLDEQEQIIRYLDFKLAKINKFIKTKKKLIKVLNELKQAVINEAVTKGTNPNVKMKPSGIEWLGDIPEHWEIRRIKNTAKILRGKFNHRPRNDERLYGGDYPFIQTGDVARANKHVVSYKQTLNEQGYSVSKEFPKGTLTMTIAANIGDVSILDFKACFPDSIVGFIPRNNMDLEYLYYVFYSMKQEFLKEAPVNTQGNLNIERVGAMCIGIPPFDEQKIIKQWIEDRTTAIDKSIEGIERGISLITEFRTRLISDVVSGRVDVRGIEIGDIVEDEIENFDEVDLEEINNEEVFEFEESEV